MVDILEATKAIVKFVSEKWAYGAGATLAIAVNYLADAEGLPRSLRFYHQGWLENNKSWIIFLVLLGVVSFALCLRRGFAIIITVLCVVLAIFFGISYESPQYVVGDWPFVVWLSYRSLLALMLGVVAAIADALPRAAA
ncbi:MAG: hypothetical protein Q8M03_06810 [Legionella sp.]|nr:hypothetical protein [Legionella sp.]